MKIVIFLAFFVFELALATDIQSSCPRACYLLYKPVCGYDTKTKTYRMFSNDCFLTVENECNNASYTAKDAGACKEVTSKCPIGCTDDVNPVCARSTYDDTYKTFPNLCSMQMENKCSKNKVLYELSYERECTQCFACRCLNEPVCAFNYKTGSYQTFPCNCTLEKENVCPTGNTPRDNFAYEYDGECKCSVECPENYDPICARSTSDGSYQTFQTNCSLEAKQKCDPDNAGDFVYKYDGACKCPVFCTLDYRPVCAMDKISGEKVEFGNQCALNAANACPENENETDEYRYSFLGDGDCKTPPPLEVPAPDEAPACPKPCTREYAPVCACDSSGLCKTFSTKCMLDNENECNGSNYYQIKMEEECSENDSAERRSADSQK